MPTFRQTQKFKQHWCRCWDKTDTFIVVRKDEIEKKLSRVMERIKEQRIATEKLALIKGKYQSIFQGMAQQSKIDEQIIKEEFE